MDEQLEAQLLPHLGVDVGERLVEQDEVAAGDERARERDPLLLPAAHLAGVLPLELGDADEVEDAPDALRDLLLLASAGPAAGTRRSGRPSCAARARTTGRSSRAGAARAERRRRARTRRRSRRGSRSSPASGCSRPAMERSSVVLPQPLGPSSTTNSPGPTSRETLVDRPRPRAVLATEGLLERAAPRRSARRDGGGRSGHAVGGRSTARGEDRPAATAPREGEHGHDDRRPRSARAGRTAPPSRRRAVVVDLEDLPADDRVPRAGEDRRGGQVADAADEQQRPAGGEAATPSAAGRCAGRCVPRRRRRRATPRAARGRPARPRCPPRPPSAGSTAPGRRASGSVSSPPRLNGSPPSASTKPTASTMCESVAGNLIAPSTIAAQPRRRADDEERDDRGREHADRRHDQPELDAVDQRLAGDGLVEDPVAIGARLRSPHGISGVQKPSSETITSASSGRRVVTAM